MIKCGSDRKNNTTSTIIGIGVESFLSRLVLHDRSDVPKAHSNALTYLRSYHILGELKFGVVGEMEEFSIEFQ